MLLSWQSRVLGAFILGRKRAFTPAERGSMCGLAPVFSLGLAALSNAPESEPEPLSVLTPRERELVSYVRLGYTNKQIALACGISPNTVRNRLAGVFERVGVGSRAELAGLGFRR